MTQRDEELAGSLWPWLSERLARVGDVALGLERDLQRGDIDGAALDDVRAHTAAFGWLVGSVAEALGGAPPSPRRVPQGLGWMVAALDQAARERGVRLSVAAPDPAPPGVTRAQAWACARVLWWLAEAAPGCSLRVRASGLGWAIEGEGPLDLACADGSGLPGHAASVGGGWRWSEVVAGCST